ncbi:E3 ubiquitin- ligase MARCH4-like protein [Labeo rohita]|uniref:E3 ubiquitin-ligase MARCH4-like protein n=1 Tax=Labeo rohita TaxID=84645 RepID=A0A498LAF4_LABRO|nr:E3 ubiquitin- ligase MARCH4-like protein [Labeo rohita]
MLRRQGKQKGRCCVLFSDLKVFLLRPPAPSASPPAFTPMNELNAEGNATSSATESHSLANGHYQPVTGETVDTRGPEDWTHSGVDSPRTLDCCSSSEDCSKEKLDERLSLNSCTDSGVRTPLCRICFQGPEQHRLELNTASMWTELSTASMWTELSTASMWTEPSTASMWTEPSTANMWTEPSTASMWTELSRASIGTEPSTANMWTEPSTASIWTEPSTASIWTEPSIAWEQNLTRKQAHGTNSRNT